ncbi:hypothetical protein Agub_g10940, partial [Astrephomene gubernaculifera]
MGPFVAPQNSCGERCWPSGYAWSRPQCGAAAQAHGRGSRRRPHRFADVNSTSSFPGLSLKASLGTSAGSYSVSRDDGTRYGLRRTACSAPSQLGDTARPFSLLMSLTEEQQRLSQAATEKLLRVIAYCGADSPVGCLLNDHDPFAHGGSSNVAGGTPPQPCESTDLAAAAALLPAVAWRWLPVAALDGWVDTSVVHLLREALLVQKAASDPTASAGELVGWCLDSCSTRAAALAALWAQCDPHPDPHPNQQPVPHPQQQPLPQQQPRSQQQPQQQQQQPQQPQQTQQTHPPSTLTPRLRSFYGLLGQRLGLRLGLGLGQPPPSDEPQTAAATGESSGSRYRGSGSSGGEAAEASLASPGARCGGTAASVIRTSSSRDAAALRAAASSGGGAGASWSAGSWAGGGRMPARAVVLCGSVTRTAPVASVTAATCTATSVRGKGRAMSGRGMPAGAREEEEDGEEVGKEFGEDADAGSGDSSSGSRRSGSRRSGSSSDVSSGISSGISGSSSGCSGGVVGDGMGVVGCEDGASAPAGDRFMGQLEEKEVLRDGGGDVVVAVSSSSSGNSGNRGSRGHGSAQQHGVPGSSSSRSSRSSSSSGMEGGAGRDADAVGDHSGAERTSDGAGDTGRQLQAPEAHGGSSSGGSSGSTAARKLFAPGGDDNATGSYDNAEVLYGDGVIPPPAATAAATGPPTRPIASLLQRPSRAVVPPPPGLEPGDPWDGEQQGGARPVATDSYGRIAPSYNDGSAQSSLLSPGSSATGFANADAREQKTSFVPVRLVATGRFPLRDLSGQLLKDGLAVPDTGPIVISNDPRVFPSSEAVLYDYVTRAEDKLAMRLEYIVDRSSSYGDVTLQLFNISRVRRKRTDNCRMFVNGQPVQIGDPGVALVPGDEVWFGNRAFAFKVEVLSGPPPAVQVALQRLCSYDNSNTLTAQQRERNLSGSNSDGGRTEVNGNATAATQPTDRDSDVNAAAADGASNGASVEHDKLAGSSSSSSSSNGGRDELDMGDLSNLARRDPRRAEQLLRRLATVRPFDAAIWLIWAQASARQGGPGSQAKARMLFRAAVAAARQMEVIPPPPPALQDSVRRTVGRSNFRRRSRRQSGDGADDDSDLDDDVRDMYEVNDGGAASYTGSGGSRRPSSMTSSLSRRRHNWLLVQALGNWAKHEWRLKMYGSARHLFRAAVDEAALHPYGIAGGGGAAIMHYWASRELDSQNIRNARIVVSEALRKCPADVALYVLAASVELEGGNLDLARTYCSRAYSLDRTDKQLFLVWPRVEAGLGDRLRARLLYERALDMHPLNTKIMNLYARFEAEEGAYREAAELYDRALSVDPLSPVMGVHNRADWASMEADLGHTGLARQLLEGGLAAHPRSPQLLVTLAKVERLEGRYTAALDLVRAAQSLAGPFNVPVIMERSLVLRALGERELAANLSRHVGAVRDLGRMKQQGYWGSEAWRAFIEATRSSEQREVVAAAKARKRELGWEPEQRGGKPQPKGEVGEGRRPTAPEVQRWMQLQQLQRRREEARRVAAMR